MADETRRKIIFLLRAKEMTVSQLAESLGRTSQAIYHQIKVLLGVGMVEIAREERVGHFIEAYYRATAEVFIFQDGELKGVHSEKAWLEALSAMSRAGLTVRTDGEFVRRVAKANVTLAKCGVQPGLEEKLAQMGESVLFTNTRAFELARLALMSDKQFEQFVASWRDLRELMTSGATKREEKD